MKAETFWSQTYSGRQFFYDDMSKNEFILDDIAHQLSNVIRYGGACHYRYSVAQHSCALAKTMEDHGFAPADCLYALFHDAAEAYTGDVRTPIKDHVTGFRNIEDKIQTALLTYMRSEYRIPVPMVAPARMKEYDRRIVIDEKFAMMTPCIHRWYGLDGMQKLGVDPTLLQELPQKLVKELWITMVRYYTEKAEEAATKTSVVSLAEYRRSK